MKFILSIVVGTVAGAICYGLGVGLMPESSDNSTECRRKHLRHGVETGIVTALVIYFTLN